MAVLDATDIIWSSSIKTDGQMIAAIEHYAITVGDLRVAQFVEGNIFSIPLKQDMFQAAYLKKISASEVQDKLEKLWSARTGQVFIDNNGKLIRVLQHINLPVSREGGVVWIPLIDDYFTTGGIFEMAGITNFDIERREKTLTIRDNTIKRATSGPQLLSMLIETVLAHLHAIDLNK